MRNRRALVCALVAVSFATGCGVSDRFVIDRKGRFADTPPGLSAVLEVSARLAAAPKSTDIVWGVADTANAEERFAELLAHAARDDGGMTVLLPFEVAERLGKAGVTPTLQPTPEQLRAAVQELRCSSYLTANVECWRYGYVYFASYATIECTVACHRVQDGTVVWRAEVRKQARGMSDREVARLALSEMFRELKQTAFPDVGATPEAGSR